MKNTIIFFILFSTLSCGQSQSTKNIISVKTPSNTAVVSILTKDDSIYIAKNNDWKICGLHGRIRSLQMRTFETVVKSGELQKTNKACKKDYGDNYDWYFNENGFKTEIMNYDTEEYNTFNNTENIKYNAHHKITETNYTDNNATDCTRTAFEYDIQGNVIEKDYYSCGLVKYSNKDVFRYNPKKQLISEEFYKNPNYGGTNPVLWNYSNCKYDTCGNQIWRFDGSVKTGCGDTTLYKYNAQNKLIEEKTSWNGCNTPKFWNITTLKYDEQGNVIEKDYYDGTSTNHAGSWIAYWKYDSYGNITETSVSSPDEANNYKITTKYEYDANNNWIKAITTFHHIGLNTQKMDDNENHQHIVISERKLSYF